MASQEEYDAYQAKNLDIIKSILADMGCRPVLFVGSGITKRYLDGPDWGSLLRQISQKAGLSGDQFNFLSQKGDNNPIKIGTLLSEEVHRWAFDGGRNHFPNEYFEAGVDKDIFIKHLACEIFTELAKNINLLKGDLKEEFILFKAVAPHCIITTNFDPLLEGAFPDFELVVGEKIIPFSLSIAGELYKIHGTSSDPNSIVLTGADYDRFLKKRRYISSKMMTYFAEFPVFILGYSLHDDNVNSILSDLGEALKDKGGLLENVFLVKRIKDLDAVTHLQEEQAIAVGDGATPALRIRTILTTDFKWIYETLGDTANPLPIPVKTLRHLAARVVELVRVDIPKNQIEIDFEQVKRLSDDPAELASVLGIGNVQNPNVRFPYSLTEIGKKLGFNGWHGANELIKTANLRLGYDLKASDNDYHMAFKVGAAGQPYHKYSEEGYELLKNIRDEPA